jgi:hypothetical protein
MMMTGTGPRLPMRLHCDFHSCVEGSDILSSLMDEPLGKVSGVDGRWVDVWLVMIPPSSILHLVWEMAFVASYIRVRRPGSNIIIHDGLLLFGHFWEAVVGSWLRILDPNQLDAIPPSHCVEGNTGAVGKIN